MPNKKFCDECLAFAMCDQGLIQAAMMNEECEHSLFPGSQQLKDIAFKELCGVFIEENCKGFEWVKELDDGLSGSIGIKWLGYIEKNPKITLDTIEEAPKPELRLVQGYMMDDEEGTTDES